MTSFGYHICGSDQAGSESVLQRHSSMEDLTAKAAYLELLVLVPRMMSCIVMA